MSGPEVAGKAPESPSPTRRSASGAALAQFDLAETCLCRYSGDLQRPACLLNPSDFPAFVTGGAHIAVMSFAARLYRTSQGCDFCDDDAPQAGSFSDDSAQQREVEPIGSVASRPNCGSPCRPQDWHAGDTKLQVMCRKNLFALFRLM